MLHEHQVRREFLSAETQPANADTGQSPAGGGVPLLYEQAAIKYYGDTQGWDEQDVRQQV